jgi:hypothetical protein
MLLHFCTVAIDDLKPEAGYPAQLLQSMLAAVMFVYDVTDFLYVYSFSLLKIEDIVSVSIASMSTSRSDFTIFNVDVLYF